MAPLKDLKRSLNAPNSTEKRHRRDARSTSLGSSNEDVQHRPSANPLNGHSPAPRPRPQLSSQAARKELEALQGKNRPSLTNQLSVEELLRTPIKFIPATHLTADAERKLVKVDNLPSSTERIAEAGKQESQSRGNEPRRNFEANTEWLHSSEASQGLYNPGNLCYRRSVLQALLHLPAFTHWIGDNHSHLRPAEAQKSRAQASFIRKSSSDLPCLACALRRLCFAYWNKSLQGNLKQALRDFDRTVAALGPSATPKWSATGSLTQADAHEFLYWIIQVLENRRNKPSHELTSLFKLTHRGVWHCPSCRTDHAGPTGTETGLVLGLTHPKRGLALTDYINTYYQTQIDGLRCDKCNWIGSAVRRTEILGPGPYVLFVQLRRFERVMRTPGKAALANGLNGHRSRNMGGRQGGNSASKRGLLAAVTAAYAGTKSASVNRKISAPVPYEHELDLSQYLSRNDDDGNHKRDSAVDDIVSDHSRSLKYRLSSIVAHAGTLDDGHYTLYTRRPVAGATEFDRSNQASEGSGTGNKETVVNVDDELVARAHRDDLLDPPGGFTPYILTYVRMS